MADIEKTFIMIKPDAVRDRKTGLIIDRIERCGLTIEKMEKCELDEDLVKVHYAHLADKPFFGDIVDFMTSGPVVKMVVSGLSAVSKMRTLMGPPTRSTRPRHDSRRLCQRREREHHPRLRFPGKRGHRDRALLRLGATTVQYAPPRGSAFAGRAAFP